MPDLKGVLLVVVRNIPFESALWFLIVMFETVMAYQLIDNSIKRAWFRRSIIVILAVSGMAWKLMIPFIAPWGLQVAFVALGFYEIGRSIKNIGIIQLAEKKKEVCFLSALILWISIILINGQLNMRTSTYHIIPLSIVMALCGTYLTYWFANLLSKTVISKCLINISQWSVCFLVTNHLVLLVVGMVVRKIVSGGMAYLLTTILAIVVMYIMSLVIFRTPLKVIFGK